MKRAFLGVVLFVGVSCSYNHFEAPEPDPVVLPVPNVSLGTLRSMYPGYPVEIDTEIVVSGSVTTSDQASNFYRSFILEDESGAVEIRAGLYDLYHTYPLGRQVVVKAEGLTLGMESGVLQLGLASDRYPTGYMEHRVVVERYVFRGEALERVHPKWLDPGNLSDEWCGRLVRIDDLRLAEAADTTWALPAEQTVTGVPKSVYLKFKNGAQDSIYVFTSGYADFADERVPRGRLSLTGILMRGEVQGREVYQLKMRDLNDVQEMAD